MVWTWQRSLRRTYGSGFTIRKDPDIVRSKLIHTTNAFIRTAWKMRVLASLPRYASMTVVAARARLGE
jgi:hypothetical protein